MDANSPDISLSKKIEICRSLRDLGSAIKTINRANGWTLITPDSWEDQHHVPALIALIHSEASEALEAFRKNDRENFAEELADVLIRILDVSAGMEINIGAAVMAKLARNARRGYRHGGKRV